jgi:hypothetical protein
MTTLTSVPADYEEALYYPITSRRLMLLLNLLALIPLAGVGAVMVGYWGWYESIGAPLMLAPLDRRLLPAGFDVWVMVALLVLTLPLHELCHGLGFKLLGVRRVRYGVKLRQFVLYARPDGDAYFYRNGFILAGLMPLALITLGCVVLLPLAPPGMRLVFVLAAAFNAGGAIGDIWTVVLVLRYPPDALVQDLGDTVMVYTRVAHSAEAG